jgi:hypothetical protein
VSRESERLFREFRHFRDSCVRNDLRVGHVFRSASNLQSRESDGNLISAAETVLTRLAGSGLLLVQDKRLPNVVTLLTGETLSGSWWSHSKSHLIFKVLTELEEHPDVLFVKLLNRKVTLVHRRLWPAWLAIVSKSEPWQVERGLHMHTREVHTESGKHAIVAEPWAAWAKTAKVKALRSNAAAKREIEDAAAALGASPPALPWR